MQIPAEEKKKNAVIVLALICLSSMVYLCIGAKTTYDKIEESERASEWETEVNWFIIIGEEKRNNTPQINRI